MVGSPKVGIRRQNWTKNTSTYRKQRIRTGFDAELLMLRNRAANEDLDAEGRANINLRLKLVMSHARPRRLIVDKKQVARATVTLNQVDRRALRAEIERLIDELEPGARAEVERPIDAEPSAGASGTPDAGTTASTRPRTPAGQPKPG